MKKLDNETFKIIEIKEDVLAGNANKLKLLLSSYAVIMEVQEAYMEDKISEKEETKKDLETKKLDAKDIVELDEIKETIAEVEKDINILEISKYDFSLSHERYTNIAVNALKLPSENFEKLSKVGYSRNGADTIYLRDLQQMADRTESIIKNSKSVKKDSDASIFSNISTEEIKQGIEDAFNNDNAIKETFENITPDEFKEKVTETAEKIKEDMSKEEAAKTVNVEPVPTPIASINKEEISADDFTKLVQINDEKLNGQKQKAEPVTSENNDEFDFSNDSEICELEVQFAEIETKYNNFKFQLEEKDALAAELTTKRDTIAKEAQNKKAEADRIIELRRIEARNRRIQQIKDNLNEYKAKSLETANKIAEQEKNIDSLNSEINNYQTSIEQSNKIISESGKTK